MIKNTKSFLSKLEDILSESGFIIRYEKGKFKSGFCILKESKIIMINTYLPLEGRINCLVEIIKTVDLELEKLTEVSLKTLRLVHAPVSETLASPPEA